MKICECGGIIVSDGIQSGPHKGGLRCQKCNHFYGWEPSNTDRRKKTVVKGSKDYWRKRLGKLVCFFCGREEHELHSKEVLEVEHVIEIKGGGKDVVENTQIYCTTCHKLKNWMTIHVKARISKGGTEGGCKKDT